MIAFIDDHREVNEVEPICRVLPIAPSTYYAQVAQRSDPAKISARGQRDRALCEEIRRVHEANFGVYGVRKVWRQLGREGIAVARCTGPPAARARGPGIASGAPNPKIVRILLAKSGRRQSGPNYVRLRLRHLGTFR